VARPAVASLLVSPTAMQLEAGESRPLTVTARDARGVTLPTRPLIFASSNPAVAAADASGGVRGVSAGSATVTVSSGEGPNGTTVTASVAVTVVQPCIVSVALAPSPLQLEVGESRALTVNLRDSRGGVVGGRVMTFTSTNTGVATVGNDGVVRGVAAGTASVTVGVANGPGCTPATATVQLTVVRAAVASLAIAPSSFQIEVGEQRGFTVTARDARGAILTGRSVALSTNTPAVATVSPSGATATGDVTPGVRGVATGTATLTVASAEGPGGTTVTATAPITVASACVASISVVPNPLQVEVGESRQLVPTARDARGVVLSGQSFTFQSTVPAVATVDGGGTVRGVSIGTAGVVVTVDGGPVGPVVARSAVAALADCPPISITVPVTVVRAAVASIALTPSPIGLEPGQATALTVTLRDVRGVILTGRPVSLASDNPASFTVTPPTATATTGDITVRALSSGSGRITVTSTEGPNNTTVTNSVAVTVQPLPPVGTAAGRLLAAGSNAAVSGATVRLTRSGGNGETVVTSRADGTWSSGAMRQGTYTGTVTTSGFKTTTILPFAVQGDVSVPAFPLTQSSVGSGSVQLTIRDAATGAAPVTAGQVRIISGIAVTPLDAANTPGTTINFGGGGVVAPFTISNTSTILVHTPGYADAIVHIAPLDGQTLVRTIAITPVVPPGTVRIVLTWGANPIDLDSWLAGPLAGGGRFRVSFSSPGNCNASPFACLDVDDVDGFGPETITITQQTAGVYRYSVNRFFGSGSIATSGARVDVYTSDGLARTFTPPPGNGDWWEVFELSNGVITGLNRYGSGQPSLVSRDAALQLKKRPATTRNP
jgi:uncharacterized protein YjdB